MKIKTILSIVTIVSLVVSILSGSYGFMQKDKAKRYKNNLYVKTVEYEDALGRSVTETTELQLTVRELKRISKKDSSQLSAYEKKVNEIVNELNHSERKLKNVEKVMKLDVTTTETIETKLQDSVINRLEMKVANVTNDFGEYLIQYNPANDSLNMKLIQRNEFYLDAFKTRATNKKGKQVFYLWRFVKHWVYSGSIKTLNDSTIVNEFVLIDIRKK